MRSCPSERRRQCAGELSTATTSLGGSQLTLAGLAVSGCGATGPVTVVLRSGQTGSPRGAFSIDAAGTLYDVSLGGALVPLDGGSISVG